MYTYFTSYFVCLNVVYTSHNTAFHLVCMMTSHVWVSILRYVIEVIALTICYYHFLRMLMHFLIPR